MMLLLSFACRKEHCMRAYSVYVPVFKTRQAIYKDITNDNSPKAIKKPGKIVVSGSLIFLNDYARGIHIIDNTDPTTPVRIAFIKIAGNIDMAVRGHILYADLNTDLVTLDISDMQHIKLVDSIRNVFPLRNNFAAASAFTSMAPYGILRNPDEMLADWVKKDTLVDCNQRGPVFVGVASPDPRVAQFSAAAGSGTSVAGSMASFAVTGSYLYALAAGQLKSFDIGQPQHPSLSSVKNESTFLETIFPFSNRLFVGSPNGMIIYNISHPAEPVKEGVFAHARVCDPVITDGKYAYVTLRSGTTCGGYTNQLDIIDVRDFSMPSLITSYKLHNPHGLAKDDDLLFICDENEGLKIYNVSEGKTISMTDQMTGINAYDVIAQDHVAIVSAIDGLYQYDYTDRSHVKLLSKMKWTRE